jgi:hypothetical protein
LPGLSTCVAGLKIPDMRQIPRPFESILRETKANLLVDWPSRTLPESLARAGYEVTAHVGPGPNEYSRYEAIGTEILVLNGLSAPDHVDIVHVFRPIEELAAIAEMSKTLGATAIWFQSGLSDEHEQDPTGCWMTESDSALARGIVESKELMYFDCPYILEAITHVG